MDEDTKSTEQAVEDSSVKLAITFKEESTIALHTTSKIKTRIKMIYLIAIIILWVCFFKLFFNQKTIKAVGYTIAFFFIMMIISDMVIPWLNNYPEMQKYQGIVMVFLYVVFPLSGVIIALIRKKKNAAV